jgi:hypothetical protein
VKKGKPKNLPASVRDRLLALARKQSEDFQLVLTRYVIERLLYRLSQSAYKDEFVLKGPMLLSPLVLGPRVRKSNWLYGGIIINTTRITQRWRSWRLTRLCKWNSTSIPYLSVARVGPTRRSAFSSVAQCDLPFVNRHGR